MGKRDLPPIAKGLEVERCRAGHRTGVCRKVVVEDIAVTQFLVSSQLYMCAVRARGPCQVGTQGQDLCSGLPYPSHIVITEWLGAITRHGLWVVHVLRCLAARLWRLH